MTIQFTCPICDMFMFAEDEKAKKAHIDSCNFMYSEQDYVKENIDMVNEPPHYKINESTEVLDVIRHALSKDEYIGYLIGNCIKYALRAPYKNNCVEDRQKMGYYAKELDKELKNA
jgi:Protein of unknwon function (DUF3310)